MNKILIIILLCLTTWQLNAQNHKLSGVIKNSTNGQTLPDSYIYTADMKHFCTSDANGRFIIELSAGSYTLIFSNVSCTADTLMVNLESDKHLNISLNERTIEEITVSAPEEALHKQVFLGKQQLSAKTMQLIPSFMGEPDPIRAMAVFPGIAESNKGSAGIFVRGGGSNNNLFAFDGVQVYSVNHLFGMLSMFNTDAIQNADIYKGGFPARYGGKTASVIDVQNKYGNSKNFKMKINLGTLQSRLLLETPVLSDKTSLLLAVRTSYLDVLTYTLFRRKLNKYPNRYMSFLEYRFYDINLNIKHEFNNKNIVKLLFYNGTDRHNVYDIGEYKEIIKIGQNNATAALKYTYLPSSVLQWKNSVGFTYFNNFFDSKNEYPENGITRETVEYFKHSIKDVSANSEINWHISNNYKIRTGISLRNHFLAPGYSRYYQKYDKDISEITAGSKYFNKQAIEANAYIENEIKIGSQMVLNAGFRYSNFNNNSMYHGYEPRINFSYMINNNLSAKLAYTEMNQYIYSISNNNQFFNPQIYAFSDSLAKPMHSKQISGGVFGKLNKSGLEYSIEAYYARYSDLYVANYIENMMFIEDPEQKQILRDGTGESYGLELFARYHNQEFSFMASYTLSWSFMKFEQLNSGKAFPSIFDKRHDVNLTANYKFNNKNSIGINAVFNSGEPFSFPVSYVAETAYNPEYYVYNDMNNRYLPVYHRLDANFKHTYTGPRGRNCYWSVNVYNLYGRANPLTVYFTKGKMKQVAMLLVIPSFNIGVYL